MSLCSSILINSFIKNTIVIYQKSTLLFYYIILQFIIYHIFYSSILYTKIIYFNIKITLKNQQYIKIQNRKTNHPHHNPQPTPTASNHQCPTHIPPTTISHQNPHNRTPKPSPQKNKNNNKKHNPTANPPTTDPPTHQHPTSHPTTVSH